MNDKSMSAYNIVIAPDSFKESLTAPEVAEAIRKGIIRAVPSANTILVPMADGGEGTVQALVQSTRGKIIQVPVHDPLMRRIHAFFGILGDGQTAVIEMAAASGIELLSEKEKNPLKTSTFGTGELINAALDTSCNKLIIGVGGSATNDGGAGMLQALGIKFIDKNGEEISPAGGSLDKIREIDTSSLDKRLNTINITIASDVSNPLYGESGATKVFGPQKGASPDMVEKLEKNLIHFSKLTGKNKGKKYHNIAGAGAAGGLGFGLISWLNAKIKPGFEVIANLAGLEERISTADLVITGEGKIDMQTKYGKTPYGVAMLAKKHNVPVLAFTGILEDEAKAMYKDIFQLIVSIRKKHMSLEESKRNAASLLQEATTKTFTQYTGLAKKHIIN
jgi:glycerate kinase